MKKNIILIVLTFAIFSCSGGGKTGTEKDIDSVGKYLALKDALVETNAAQARKAAEAFLNIGMDDSIKEALEIIAGTTDIAVQRKAFEELSAGMYNLVKTKGSEITLYKQYCPMAFDNKGAYWLAAEKEVNNPYFGDEMLHCGSVQESISN